MASHRLGKYWTAAALNRRGWSKALIKELLPEPRVIPMDGHSARVWKKETVRAAEGTARFAEQMLQNAGGPRRTGLALNQVWQTAVHEDTLSWRLAGHYHNAILHRMRRTVSLPACPMF